MIILGHFWQRFIMDVGNLLQKNKNLIYLSIIYIHLDIRSSGKLPLYDVTFVLPTSFTTKNEKNFHVTKNYSCYYLVLGSLIITWWTKKKKKELDRDRTSVATISQNFAKQNSDFQNWFRKIKVAKFCKTFGHLLAVQMTVNITESEYFSFFVSCVANCT